MVGPQFLELFEAGCLWVVEFTFLNSLLQHLLASSNITFNSGKSVGFNKLLMNLVYLCANYVRFSVCCLSPGVAYALPVVPTVGT